MYSPNPCPQGGDHYERGDHVGETLRHRGTTQFLVDAATPEETLSARDSILGRVIASEPSRWPSQPIEDPIWGLIRIIMAQQISTGVACRLAERVKSTYPLLTAPSPATILEAANLRALGLSERRAQCCITV